MPLGLLIGLPCWETWHWRFSMCLQSLSPPMNYSTRTMPVVGKRIDIARNEIIEAALCDDAQHVMFLDTDVLFPPHTMMALINRLKNNPDLKIVSGVYWSKSNPCFPLIFDEAGLGSKVDWVVGDFLEDVGYAIGMGLCLIDCDVFRAIEPPWYEVNYGLNIDSETGGISAASITEDLIFCEKAHAAGYKISVDTGIQAGHLDIGSNTIFGLNDSMPQAQGREPRKSDTLYVGNILAGGEPAHVLAKDPTLLPTWIGGADRIPTGDTYEKVKVKDPDVHPVSLPEVTNDWAAHVSPGGSIEVMLPDWAEGLKKGMAISGNVYGPEFIEKGLTQAGMVEVKRVSGNDYHVISAVKPQTDEPLVSIIIPVKDLHDMTSQCVASIRDNTEGSYEIIVVDNASENPYQNIGDKLLTLKTPLSYGKAVTEGAKLSHASYIVLLNNDTVVTQGDWLEELLKRIRGNGNVACVGPKQIHPNNTVYHAGVAFSEEGVPFHAFLGWGRDHAAVEQEQIALALNFGCVLIRREAFDNFPLDSRYGGVGNYEDIDWCLTIRKAGLQCVYVPSVEIIHFGGQTLSQNPEEAQKSIEANRAKFVEKWGSEKELMGLKAEENVQAD